MILIIIGFVFVVDSSDIDRLEEARNELYTVVNREENKDIPFVVIANKQDLPSKYTCFSK
jgi:signal recognition particle receptor subunit beta